MQNYATYFFFFLIYLFIYLFFFFCIGYLDRGLVLTEAEKSHSRVASSHNNIVAQVWRSQNLGDTNI